MVDQEGVTVVALSKPRIATKCSVEQALQKRRSSRTYSEQKIRMAELSQLLWAAQGITGHYDKRTAPSAGALHCMSLTVVAAAVDDFHFAGTARTLAAASRGQKDVLGRERGQQCPTAFDAQGVRRVIVDVDFDRADVDHQSSRHEQRANQHDDDTGEE